MRVMMKVKIPVTSGNAAIANGSLPETIVEFVKAYKPEASYFTAETGLRTAMFFFDMTDPSDLPAIAEPFFMKLGARVTVTPAMNLDDMKAGVQKAMARG